MLVLRLLVLAGCLLGVLAHPAMAALDHVSGFNADRTALEPTRDPAKVAYSLANGFPIWYSDGTTIDGSPLKLQLCLDQVVQKAGGGTFLPCFTEAPFPGPISFPNNFGPEAFWWAATAATTFNSRQDGVEEVGGDMLYIAALEAAFGLDLGAFDSDQIAFNRIRLRISVPRPGIYQVTHPYGTYTYRVEDSGRRAINQTQDVGNLQPLPSGPPPSGDFTLALEDGEVPAPDFDPFVDPLAHNGVIDILGRGVGPFLVAAEEPGGNPLPLIAAVGGDLYLADPGDVIHIEVPVTGSPFEFAPGEFANFFRLELLSLLVPDPNIQGGLRAVDPSSEDFFLNANNSQVVEVSRFQIMGKLFRDLENLPPTSVDDFVATGKGSSVDIDVIANDIDVFQAGQNEYGINPQALGLVTGLGDQFRLARPLATAEGGTVQRFTNISTGRSSFNYRPPSNDFTGWDSFEYVVQDHGGLISEPALVEVLVEDVTLDRAEYRPRLGKWRIEGTSSFTGDEVTGPNFIDIYAGPRAALAGAQGVTTAATGQMALRVPDAGIDYVLTVDPLPASPISSITIRLDAPPENPALFEVFFAPLDGQFTGSVSGTLTAAQSLFPLGEAVDAILSGRTYVHVTTQANPLGELRGPIYRPVISHEVPVDAEGRWVFEGKSVVSPGLLPNVSAESKHGIRTPALPLRLR